MISSIDIKNKEISNENNIEEYHKLNNIWVLWFHLPSINDWSINSYKKICDLNYVEDVIVIINYLNENIITNSCFFIMKKGILPQWECPKNKNGGAFSYRISNKYIFDTFRDLSYCLCGETITENILFSNSINGISISPKKNFCVLKIWCNSIDFQNPAVITNKIKNIEPKTALFRQHAPEF